MPTSHPRISVTKDPELADALDRARRALGAERKDASLVRELAVRGAQGLEMDENERRRMLSEMADPDLGGLDLDVMATVEQAGLDGLPPPTEPSG